MQDYRFYQRLIDFQLKTNVNKLNVTGFFQALLLFLLTGLPKHEEREEI